MNHEENERLLHALRHHQLELEMQNEELRRTHEELDALRARYVDLFDRAPMGYAMLSEKGLIVEANLTLETQLGVPRAELVMQPLFRFIFPEDQDIYQRHRRQLFDTGQSQTCEIRMLRADNAPFWVQLEATATKIDAGSAAYRIIIIDITERKQLEDARLFLLRCGATGSGEEFFQSLAGYLAQSLNSDYVCIDRL